MTNEGADKRGSHGGNAVGRRCYHSGQRWSVVTRFESSDVNGFEVFERGNEFALYSEKGKCLAKKILFNPWVT